MRSLAGLPLLVVVTVAAAACAGPTPATVTFGAGEAESSSSSKDTTDSKSSSSNAANAANAPTKTQSDAIFGSSPFAAGTPKDGPAKGKSDHTAVNAQKDPSGADCMSCHASTFAFGGTIYTDANGSSPVAGAEIRVVTPDGQTFASAFSDADGNFWVDTTGTVMPEGSRVGVRNGKNEMTMGGKIGGSIGNGCNASSCHGLATNRVNLK